jgi:ATP-dependent Clp protease, protease subunit
MTDTNDENPPDNEKEALRISFADLPPETQQPRLIALFGDLDEEAVEDVCMGLITLKNSTIKEGENVPDQTINFCISTWGGDALGMFGIYDLMRMIKKECDISTFAMGKVMSAGVLLLAAGTKGKRKIGKHTRIMIHSIRGGHFGPVHLLENEMKETRWVQEQHIDAMVAETKLTRTALKKMLNKKVDVYLNAKEAVELGIADIIV